MASGKPTLQTSRSSPHSYCGGGYPHVCCDAARRPPRRTVPLQLYSPPAAGALECAAREWAAPGVCYISVEVLTTRLAVFCMLLSVLITSGCGRSMEKQAREQVRVLGGASLKKDAVEVTDGKVSGNLATADVTIRTAVKLRQVDGNWVLDEVRLGDRRWEKVDRILAAIEAARIETTRDQMNQVIEGVREYRQAEGNLPSVDSYEALIDILSPAYIGSVIRLDSWDNPYILDQEDGAFRIRSAGPDGKLGTDDDLVVDA